jgi:predicted RNA-binding protein with PUA-like domain
MAAARAQTRHWLMKSEPDAFSIADLRRKRTSPWDGVRNHVARNNMDAMQLGDLVLFYHSSCSPPGVVGIARVCKTAYPDPTAFDPKSDYFDAKSGPDNPRWRMVDVEFVTELPEMVTLEQLKADPALGDMVVVRASRLSVQPVTAEQFEHVVRRGGLTDVPSLPSG